jgi:hypothetical protein
MGEAQPLHVEALHERINEADRVLLADVIIESFREEGHLIPVAAFDMALRRPPCGQGNDLDLPYRTPDFSHRLSLEPTRRADVNCILIWL